MTDRSHSIARRRRSALVLVLLLVSPAAPTTRTSCSSGWSSKSARSSRASSRCRRPRSSIRSPTSALDAVEPFSTQKLDGRAQAGSAAAQFAARRRDQPAQGAARGLPGRQHDDGGQRHPQRAARMRCSRSTASSTRSSRATISARTTERSRRSPRPTLPIVRSFRMQRANGSSATAPSSFRRRRDEWHEGDIDGSLALATPWRSHSWREPSFPAWSQNAIQSINSSQQAGSEVIRVELTRAARRSPGRLHRPGAAAHRPRPARRRQRARQVERRNQPGQPALGERRPVG